MPFINKIVNHIDEKLQAGNLADRLFQNSQFAGLVQQVPISVKGAKPVWIPALLEAKGEFTPVVPDDQYVLQTYHRIISNKFEFIKGHQFGSTLKGTRCLSQMVMNVIAFTAKLNLTMDQLEALFINDFPDILEKSFTDEWKFNQIVIQASESRFEQVQLFLEEYRGENYFLKPESILFQIKYTIDATFRKGCFNVCDC